MDPFVSTVIKQGLVIAGGAGMLAFAIYVTVKMMSLQHALTLNLVPAPLP